ncbi:MAG: ribonuclease Z [Bacteroidota bacterium]|nr:ribonuclease Z [Bacteroidota bacterium]
MRKIFNLTILGKSSAIPTSESFPSSQALQSDNAVFLIDCGEGCQMQLRKNKISFKQIRHIFISHLHGDHFYGLFGLLSTMALLGRKHALNIYGHEKLEHIIKFISTQAGKALDFPIVFHSLTYDKKMLILETKRMKVFSFPLRHRIPTCGFLFEEKSNYRNIRTEMIEKYEMSYLEIRRTKQGADLIRAGKQLADNDTLCFPAEKPRSYAYCSDTTYNAKTAVFVKNVDLLYHEATFGDDMAGKEEAYFHSTAKQAAQVAKSAKVGTLIIGHFSTRYKTADILLKEAQTIFPQTRAADENQCIPIGETVEK